MLRRMDRMPMELQFTFHAPASADCVLAENYAVLCGLDSEHAQIKECMDFGREFRSATNTGPGTNSRELAQRRQSATSFGTTWAHAGHRKFQRPTCDDWSFHLRAHIDMELTWEIAEVVIGRSPYERGLARLAGIEPTTLGFGGRYSIH